MLYRINRASSRFWNEDMNYLIGHTLYVPEDYFGIRFGMEDCFVVRRGTFDLISPDTNEWEEGISVWYIARDWCSVSGNYVEFFDAL